jgi:hypothetical protein
MAPRDPDAAVVGIFKNDAVKNDAKSAAAGRPIYDDREVCEIRVAGSRDVKVFPATAVSHWIEDPQTGEQTPVTYAERFARQYRQFKEQVAQTKSGTPLSETQFLTEARRAELRALNIYTVEALASVDGQELKNLGTGGRELKNRALEYLENAQRNIPNTELIAELEALRARNAMLEEDAARTRAVQAEGEFAEMSDEQIREFVRENSGHEPQGQLNRKTLIRIAMDLQKEVA